MSKWIVGSGVVLIVASSLGGGCGGNVEVDPSAGGSSSASGMGNAGATPSTSSGQGNAGNVGNVGNAGQGGAGASSCEGLDEIPCLGAYPSCAPVYDDACCPSCEPGPCADCIDWQFHHCAPFEEVCDAPPPCGNATIWACSGGTPSCTGQAGNCGADPGCAQATCSVESGPCPGDECHPVTAEICGPALCNAIPPTCPGGTLPEHEADCYTGWCIPADVCR